MSSYPSGKVIFLLLLFLEFSKNFHIQAQESILREWQVWLIEAENGDTVFLPAGFFQFNRSLSIDDKKNLVVQGAGMHNTIISFKNQTDGAEGLKINRCANLTLLNLTILDAKGDCIKASYCENITFKNISTRWSGNPSKKNGGYGIYPVSCNGVIIEGCVAEAASDAGIYVGQSTHVLVKNCIARYNVAGIEIENCKHAEVLGCTVYQNSGGILVFDLPELPVKAGSNIRVHYNTVMANNHKNFAPKGNIVGQVPPGTGIMVLSGSDVIVEHNMVCDNKTTSCAIVSFFISRRPFKDSLYNPYPRNVLIRQNTFQRRRMTPALNYSIGLFAFLKFGRRVPHIVYDGILPLGVSDINPHNIRIGQNSDNSFVFLDAGHKFRNISRDIEPFREILKP